MYNLSRKILDEKSFFLEFFEQNGNLNLRKFKKKILQQKTGKHFEFFSFLEHCMFFSIFFLQKLFCNVTSLPDVILDINHFRIKDVFLELKH